jgi:hypothetical protein
MFSNAIPKRTDVDEMGKVGNFVAVCRVCHPTEIALGEENKLRAREWLINLSV